MGSRLIVKSGKRTIVLQSEQIRWVGAEKDYLRLNMGTDSLLIRRTMNDFLHLLDPSSFMRVHRSTIVNLDHVREMNPQYSGDYEVVMKDNTRLHMSRRYRDAFFDLLRVAGLRSAVRLSDNSAEKG